ncbi:MAG: rod shape-determining protein MreC [Clostridia bacterium]|nr:rod shape-determining protein MreC [Clostridia bacterium]
MNTPRYKKILIRILKIILVIIVFISIAFTSGNSRSKLWVENLINGIINIPQNIKNYFDYITQSEKNISYDINELRIKNKELTDRVNELENKMIDYNLILQESKEYQSLKQTNKTYNNYDIVIANITYKTQNNWDDLYVIDKGSSDGIKQNMTVITNEGLVGYISQVGTHSSKVTSILDASSSFSAVASKTREQVIAKGDYNLKNENKIIITDIPLKVTYKSGDSFETSGMGNKYPKGIKVGIVSEFISKENPLDNIAIVDVAVDFDRLERVAVIIQENEDNEFESVM